MSYGRLNKPRFYIDTINWLASRGWSKETEVSITSNGVQTNYNKYQVVDLNPLNPCVFDTNGETTDLIIEIDQTVGTMPINFIALLNHNLYAAGAYLQLNHHIATITAYNVGTQATLVSNIGCDEYAGDALSVDFDSGDVDSIADLSAAVNTRYVAAVIRPVPGGAGTFDADISIGAILIGYSHTMPNSGDLNVKRDMAFDGTRVRETDGGKRYGHASWVAGNDGNDYAPFRNAVTNNYFRRPGGRQAYNVDFSYIADTGLFPADWSDVDSGNESDFGTLVYNKTAGSLLPFIWTPDSTSKVVGDYLFARIVSDFAPQQIANQAYSMKIRIEEEL